MRFLFVVLNFLLPLVSFAANPFDYQLSAPIPGGGTTVQGSEFANYAQYVFPFLLSIAAGSALIMFVWGGIEYMAAAGNPSRLGAAKSRMLAALGGLLLAISSVVLLRTINPELVKLKLNLEPVGIVNKNLGDAVCGGKDFGTCGDPNASCQLQSGSYTCVVDSSRPPPTCPAICGDCSGSCNANNALECKLRGASRCTPCNQDSSQPYRCD